MSFCKSGLLAFTADCEPVKNTYTARQNWMPTTETREFWKPHIMGIIWNPCIGGSDAASTLNNPSFSQLSLSTYGMNHMSNVRIFRHGKQRSQNSHLRKQHPAFHMNPHTIPTSILSGHVGSWKGTQQHWMQTLLHPQLNGVVCSKTLQISLSK